MLGFFRILLVSTHYNVVHGHTFLQVCLVGIQFFSALLHFLCCNIAARFQIYLMVLSIPNNTIYMGD